MAATIIDGKSLAAATRVSLKSRIDALAARGVRPGLAAVLVGTDPASHVYVRNKVRACGRRAFRSPRIRGRHSKLCWNGWRC
jgi:methylenetetrahydrofolate dehydrogenase (NADP+)/methenyltetrahydrofolate cyclohydrolase